MGRGDGAAATQPTTIPNPAPEWKDPCRSAMIYHPANLTERHTVVPYKISLKSVPYQLTQNPKTHKKARGINPRALIYTALSFKLLAAELCAALHELILLLSGNFSLCEELLSTLGELTHKTCVTNLVLEELSVICQVGLLAVKLESVLALGNKARIVTEEVPVTGLDGKLDLGLRVCHAALEAVHLTGSVADDKGGTVVALGLNDSLNCLLEVRGHTDLCNI